MKATTLLRALVAILLLSPAPALAYIDPGTGSMLLQSLLAAIAVAAVAGKTVWQKIKDFFRREKPRDLEP